MRAMRDGRGIAAAWTIGVAVVIAALGGCGGGGGGAKATRPNPGELMPSRSAMEAETFARAKYERLAADGVVGSDRAARIGEVIQDLDRAIASDPGFPLWLSRKADLLMSLSPPRDREAEDLYRRSLGPGFDKGAMTGSERWAPGWLGLGRMRALTGDTEGAHEMFRNASRALTWFDDAAPPQRGGLLGLLTGGGGGPTQPKPTDPTLPEADRKRILLAAIAEDNAWDIAAWPIGVTDPLGANVDPKRRVRAEIAFQKALLEGGPTDPDAFAEVFKWDPDHFRARYEQASRLVRASRYADADAAYSTYVDPRNPKLMSHPDALLLAATIHARRYLQEGVEGQAELAERYLLVMDDKHRWDARAYILRAQVLARWGSATKDQVKVRKAEACLAAGEQRLAGFDVPDGPYREQIPRWRGEIEVAKAEIKKAIGS